MSEGHGKISARYARWKTLAHARSRSLENTSVRTNRIFVGLALIAACGGKDKLPAVDTTTTTVSKILSAGEAMLAVPGGSIWYKRSGQGTATPVILLHGGPGFSSFYLKPLEEIGGDRPVIRYDQLGGGKSSKITDTTMFTIPHFVAELDSLRAALGMATVHLVGHSWGTILAFEYYRAHPDHVASLTLASPALNLPAWEANAKQLVATLSDSAQRAIKTRETEKKFDAPDYQAALNEFYGKYVWRRPVEADLDSMFKTVNENIYNYMQGPSEFTITGTLKPYDVTSSLNGIKVPTLYTVGEFDEANPDIVKGFAAKTPGAKVVVIPGAAHITTWDNPSAMTTAVRSFLLHADSTAKP
jgi:proline iminopeptidase